MNSRLEKLGFELEEEVVFFPYTVDTYLPELHIAVEWDGPMHGLSRKRDAIRDATLLEKYSLPVVRFATLAGFERAMEAYEKEYADSADERMIQFQMSLDESNF